jgi:uncharacterized protein YjbJ (UPF0337 family)
MIVKGNLTRVRMIGNGRKMAYGSYATMKGDGIIDLMKGLFSGGIKALGSLFRSSGAKQLVSNALTTGKNLAKDAVKEGLSTIVKDVSADPMKYVNKGVELVNQLKENPQAVAQVEAQKFGKTILNIAKEKVVKPTMDQYREEFEGVKEKAKSDIQSQIRTQQDAIQTNLGNLISGMGVKPRKLEGKKGGKIASKPVASSNKKIMNHLRGCGLVPL